MTLSPELVLDILRGIGLGAGVGLFLWFMRSNTVIRRVWITVVFLVLSFNTSIILHDANIIYQEFFTRLAIAASILFSVNLITQIIDITLWEGLFANRRHIPVPRLLIDLFNFAVLITATLLLLNQLFAVDLSALLVTSTVLSAVIGLALQDMLGNVIAGLAIQLERPFEVGDWVRVSGQEGRVSQMNWRTLTIHTRENHNTIVPNSNVARQDVVNFSRPTLLQLQIVTVSMGYQDPPSIVKDILKRAAIEAQGVLKNPTPEILIKNFGDYSIHYNVVYWIDDYAQALRIHDAVLNRVWYGLSRAGLAMPYPTQHITTLQLAHDHEEQVQERLRREVFDELRGLAVFSPLNNEQVELLARSSVIHRYAPGEVLVRQGDPGDSLFTIKSGKVRVDVRSDKGQMKTVDTIGDDGFFGEMSLLTGEPRSASIVAEVETEVVVVNKDAFAEVLKSDVNLPDALSHTLQNRMKNAAARAALWDAIIDPKQGDQQTALMRRIRGFFGLRQ